MVDEELDNFLEGSDNVDENAFMDDIFNSQEDPDSRIEPRSDKESLEVEIDADMVNIYNDDVEEESAVDESPRTHIAPLSLDKETLQEQTVLTEDTPSSTDKEKLKELTVTDPLLSSSTPSSSSPKPKTGHFSRYKSFIQQMGGHYELLLDRQKTQANIAIMNAEAIQKEHENLRAEVISQVNDSIANYIPPQVDSFLRDYMSNNILHVHPTQPSCLSAQDLQHQLYLMMKDDEQLCNADLPIWLSLKIKFEKITTTTSCQTYAIRPRDHDDNQDDDAPPEGGVHGNSRQKKYTLSLHKFPTVAFPDDDMEDQTSRWKEQRDNPKKLYLDSKIVEVIRTLYELGHEHKFITEIIARRANGKIDPIIEQDYKYLNKNDIEDLYLLCINGKVDDYKETRLLGSLIVFIRATVI
ncbi:hypothetical protein Tco_0744302 [Tanacetum coccineum]